MTSETFVFGVPIPQKSLVGAAVGRYAARLGPGKVEACVERRRGGRFRVACATACPTDASAYDIDRELEAHLNDHPSVDWGAEVSRPNRPRSRGLPTQDSAAS